MLDVANKYEKELQLLFVDTWYKDKYKYYHYACFYDAYKNSDSTWEGNRFVSKNKSGNIIGYIGYSLSRTNDYANGLCAINFTDNKVVFGRDLIQVLDDIFTKFNIRKLSFSVVVGNPVERSYDRLIKQYGGSIVGIKKKEVKLMDNKYYDSKMYEIFREDYLLHKNKNKEM